MCNGCILSQGKLGSACYASATITHEDGTTWCAPHYAVYLTDAKRFERAKTKGAILDHQRTVKYNMHLQTWYGADATKQKQLAKTLKDAERHAKTWRELGIDTEWIDALIEEYKNDARGK